MKKRTALKRTAVGLLALVSSALVLSGCSSGSAAPSAAAAGTQSSAGKKTFKIALECDAAPYNWTQTDNSNNAVPIVGSNTYCNGYDIQVAKKIADSMGATLEVYKTEWTAIPTAVISGKVDAGICGMSVTEERKKTLLFSEPYYISQYVALVKKDGKYANAKSVADLKGASCTSQQSTSWYELLKQIPNGQIQPALADVPTMLVSLTSGKCDVLTCEKPTGLSAVRAYPNVKMLEFSGSGAFKANEEEMHICAALAKNNTQLKEKIDSVLKGFSADDQSKLMDWSVKNQPST